NGGNGAGFSDGAFVGMINQDIKIENCETGKITLGSCQNPDQLVLQNNGNLEINGPLKISAGSPGVNKVLKSDAEGNANWGEIRGTIETVYSIAGTTGNSPLPSNPGWELIGPTEIISIKSNQQIVSSVSISLGRTTPAGGNAFCLAIGYRPIAGSEVYDGTTNICHVPRFSGTHERVGYAVSDTFTLAPGTYEIGVAIQANVNYFDYNEYIMGYIMIINK
ncbi:MAG: hypothetical protein H7246_18255, partial [Phycisphaerae bacterium]|nr:hypothetical protein [Saprospiraceae bacterium]